jgi:uncharacterized protein YceH (UPF0502 family)
MEEILNEQELRVLGCLIEKDRTTPEYYPLTLNALVNACNQKSNRSPIVLYDRETVAKTVDGLRWKGWVVVVDEAGSRTEKYRHAFPEKTGLGEAETSVLAELMLRGPQTPGEIRGRASRMHGFAGLDDVVAILHELESRDPALLVRLPRQAGRKERRYAHLFGGPIDVEEEVAPPPAAPTAKTGRVGELEAAVASLQERVDSLEQALAEFRSQFD